MDGLLTGSIYFYTHTYGRFSNLLLKFTAQFDQVIYKIKFYAY